MLDGALAECVAAVVVDDHVVARRTASGGRGQAALLAGLTQDALSAAGLAISQPAGGMTRSWPAFPEIKAVGGYATSWATVIKRA